MAAEQEEIDIKIKASVDASNIGDLKKSIKELKSAALEVGDVTSAEYKKIAKAAGEAQDKLNDVNMSVKQLSGEPLENLVSGFKGVGQSIASMDLKGFKTSLNTVKMSFAELTATMLANPIFLIGAVIAAVVAGLFLLKDAIPGVGAAFKALGDVVDSVLQGIKDFTDAIGLTNFAAKKAAQETVEAQKKAAEAVNDRYDLEIRKAKAAGKETEQLEIEKIKAVQESVKLQIDALIKLQEVKGALNEDEQKNLDELKKKNLQLIGDLEVANIAANKKIEDDREKKQKKDDEDHQKYLKKLDEKKAALAKYNDEIESLEQKYEFDDRARLEQKYKDDLDKVKGNTYEEKLLKDTIREEEAKALEEFDNKKALLVEQAKMRQQKADEDALDELKKNHDLQVALENDYNQTQEQVDADYEEALKNNRKLTFEEFAKNYRQDADAAEAANKKKIKDEEDAAKKIRDTAEKTKNDKIKAAQGAFQASAQLVNAIEALENASYQAKRKQVRAGSAEDIELQKKHFKASKALAITNAAIQTAMAVIAAYTSGAAVPIIGVGLGPAMAAIAGVAGAVQIGVIAAKQFSPEGGDSGGGSAGSTPGAPAIPDVQAPQAPQFQAPTFLGLGQNNLIGGSLAKDQRVYVVESDITNTQRRVSTIEGRSILGG